MSNETSQNPPAGWYPDPSKKAKKRYWDGSKWSITDVEYRERQQVKKMQERSEAKRPTESKRPVSRPGSATPVAAAGVGAASVSRPVNNSSAEPEEVETVNEPEVNIFEEADDAVEVNETENNVTGEEETNIIVEEDSSGGVKLINTDDGSSGLVKCPKCGSTEAHYNESNETLTCRHCRHSWKANVLLNEKYDLNSPISDLYGTVVTSGVSNIDVDSSNMATIKCQGCGAEVVINTENSTGARCHWCRQHLSMNQQISNGAVPDGILPFSLTREDAIQKIREFSKNRKFFAHKKFKKEFAPDNVLGVYMPYLVVDGNTHVRFDGKGEILKRRYTVDKKTYYDADEYNVTREFDLTIDDHTLESSAERADFNTKENTNNIINTILPFDTENIVPFDSRYLQNYTSEKRDVNVEAVASKAYRDFLFIARGDAQRTTKRYDRGVRWEQEMLDVKGARWVATYLPVWLYSYYHEEGGKGMVHYIAVNGRTGETMGSVPINKGLMVGMSGLMSLAGLGVSVAGFIALF